MKTLSKNVNLLFLIAIRNLTRMPETPAVSNVINSFILSYDSNPEEFHIFQGKNVIKYKNNIYKKGEQTLYMKMLTIPKFCNLPAIKLKRAICIKEYFEEYFNFANSTYYWIFGRPVLTDHW